MVAAEYQEHFGEHAFDDREPTSARPRSIHAGGMGRKYYENLESGDAGAAAVPRESEEV
ncbi:MAG: hypothetical protein R2710_23600 [Acidimicrobiales bacterium]